MSHGTFFTSLGCMDGRVQDPVAQYGRQKFGVLFADTITEAGLVGLLAKDQVDPNLLESLENKINISLEKHHSKGVIVHGHQECAGNTVDDQKHKDDVRKTVEVIRSLVDSSIPVQGVFVVNSDHGWTVEELPQTKLA